MSATRGSNMSEVFVSRVIEAPIEQVWAIIRDFNSLPRWLPTAASSTIEGNEPADRIGAVRRVVLRSGGVMRERLTGLDDLSHSCSYRIIESELPVDDFVANLSLLPISETNHTFVQWRAWFVVLRGSRQDMIDAAAEHVYKPGLATLAALMQH
jgi:NADPH2:quinone reductase